MAALHRLPVCPRTLPGRHSVQRRSAGWLFSAASTNRVTYGNKDHPAASIPRVSAVATCQDIRPSAALTSTVPKSPQANWLPGTTRGGSAHSAPAGPRIQYELGLRSFVEERDGRRVPVQNAELMSRMTQVLQGAAAPLGAALAPGQISLKTVQGLITTMQARAAVQTASAALPA
jgi:hypothetical protein